MVVHVLKVLLGNESRTFSEAVAAFLRGEPDVKVIGFAESAEAIEERSGRQSPDAVLLDVHLLELDEGLVHRLKRTSPPPLVIVMGLYDEPEDREFAAGCGADGFVAKTEFGHRFMPLLRTLTAPGRSTAQHP
jgi:DNA-binding NarL/FixJ family response regulator